MMRELEMVAWSEGHARVGGVDEAGRGPLAGPVVAACVVLPRVLDPRLVGLTDSKALSPTTRGRYRPIILDTAIFVGVGLASEREIEAINILQATFLAMRRAMAGAELDLALVDGNRPIAGYEGAQRAVVKGDARCMAIAAASVIAKEWRDDHMRELALRYPLYGFERHKGYGTAAHRQAIARLGPCEAHRLSFLGSK